MRVRRKRCLLCVVILFMMTPWALAYEEVEDLVDIFATDSAFIAVVDGKRNFSEAKGSSETILWQGAKGEIGAFLTNERLLAVSVRSGQWNVRSLKIIEKKAPPDMLIAAHLLIMLTGERIVTFGTHTGGPLANRSSPKRRKAGSPPWSPRLGHSGFPPIAEALPKFVSN